MDRLKWNKDFALEQVADDISLLDELVQIFKESCVADLRLIEEGIASKNAEMVCGAAHSIKGASASLGLEGIREIALDIEFDSKKGSLQVAKLRFAHLAELLNCLQQL